jgi:hypothetical protein
MGNQLSNIPGCSACVRNEKNEEISVDDKEVKNRQKQKNKNEKSNPTVKSANDFLSGESNDFDNIDNTFKTNDSKLNFKSNNKSNRDEIKKEDEEKKTIDKKTAKIIRTIYKTNLIRKIQKIYRNYKKNNKKKNEKTNLSRNLSFSDIKKDNKNLKNENLPNNSSNNQNEKEQLHSEESIKGEYIESSVKDEFNDIRLKNKIEFNKMQNKIIQQIDATKKINEAEQIKNMINTKEPVRNDNFNFANQDNAFDSKSKPNPKKEEELEKENIKANDEKKIDTYSKSKEKNNHVQFNSSQTLESSKKDSKNFYFSSKGNNRSTNKVSNFEDKKDDDKNSDLNKSKKNYFLKSDTKRQKSSNKNDIEENEKIIHQGKFDMISLKGDSIYGDKSTLYFSNKGTYKQTFSMNDPEKTDLGINRINKNLFFNNPIEDSKHIKF